MRWLLLVSAVFLVNGKLTREENKKRLDTCGKGSGPWMWALTDNRGDRLMAATPISPRHFITYSMTLLTRNRKWIHSRESIDKNFHNEYAIVEIPSEVLTLLRFAPLDKLNDTSYKPPVVVKGYFLGLCSDFVKQQFWFGHAPMILEVKNDLGVDYPCAKKQEVKVGDLAETWRLYPFGRVYHYDIKISLLYKIEFAVPMFGKDLTYDRGGAVVQKFDGRWIMTGMSGASMHVSEYPTQRPFTKLSHFMDDICQVSGVCDPSMPFPEPDPVIEKKNEQSGTSGKSGKEETKEEQAENVTMTKGTGVVLMMVFAYLWK
uniref:Peptidase S1 domain-containing protein n=1 Tax=Caenorhabditis tropicalis TaxID=1561998 RepID=A0A1I7UP01_9PELO